MQDEPLRTTTFLMTRADALAYEQAATRLSPLGVLALIGWLGLWGAGALLIPPEWAGPRFGVASSLLVSVLVLIAYVLVLLLISVRQALRARRRLKRPVEVTLGEWPGRLDLVGAGMPRSVAFPDIRRVLLTRSHLFLDTDEDVVILPRRAFLEEGTIEDLARRIEGIPKSPPAPDEPQTPQVPAA